MSDSYRDGRHLPQTGQKSSDIDVRSAYQPAYEYDSYGYYDMPGGSAGSAKEQVQQILDMLFRRKWMVLGVLILVLGGTAAYTFTRTPQYQTSAYVILDKGQTVVQAADPSGTQQNLFAVNSRSVWGEILLLQISDQLRRRVYARLEEVQDEGENASLLRAVDSVRALQGGQLLSAALQSSWVEFTALGGSDNIILVTGKSAIPEHTAVIANLYAQEYVKMTKEASRTYVSTLRESLVVQERERRTALDNIERQIQKYRNEAGVVGLDPGGANLVAAVATLESAREQDLIELQMQESTLILIEEEMGELNPALSTNVASSLSDQIGLVQSDLAAKQSELAQIIRRNPEFEGRDMVQLRPLRARIALMQREVDSLSNAYVTQTLASGNISSSADAIAHLATLNQQASDKRISIGGLKAKIRVIESKLKEHDAELGALPSQTLRLAQFERSRLEAERMYSYVTDRLQAVEIQEQAEPGYASVLRSAYTPVIPYYPEPIKDLTLGAFFGLILALGLAFILDKLDARIYQPGQLKSQGYREIGIIPDMRELIATDLDGQEFFEHDGIRFSTSLVSVLSPISVISEAYRQVRTYLQFNLAEDEARTIMISSPGPGEGKSTTAANVAICMAQAGKKTLLIDADLRRPRQHYLFGLKRDKGLRELLMNGNGYDETSWTTFIDNLSVLSASKTSGVEPELAKRVVDATRQAMMVKHPPELLGSEKMIAFLNEMKDLFDVIIIDSPPLLAATDAAILSTRCMATVIVARAGRTRGGELTHAMDALADLGVRPLGVILNDFDVTKSIGQKYRYKHYADYAGYLSDGSEVDYS